MTTSKNLKWSGISAIMGGVLACLVAPLMSVGYYSSYAMPSETPPFWFSTAQPILGLFLSFADVKTAYTTYGKIFAVVYLLFLPGVFALHSMQERAKSRFEKYSFIFLAAALIASFFGVSFDYWGIKQGWTIELLGMLLLQFAATLYGVALLRLKIVPISQAILLLGSIPFCIISFLLLKQIPSAPTLPFALASIALGLFILRKSKTQENAKVAAFAALIAKI